MDTSGEQGLGDTPRDQFSKLRQDKISLARFTREQDALSLISQGKLNEAEMIYKELAEEGSDSHIIQGNLGAVLQMKGDLQNAITCYEKALQLKPNYPDALNNLGAALKDRGDLTAAIDAYNRALQFKPNYPEALNNLGIALRIVAT